MSERVGTLRVIPLDATWTDAIHAIEVRGYPFPWTLSIIRDCFKSGTAVWGVLEDSSLVAYAFLSMAVGEAHVLNICVAPEHQGRGIGRQLMDHLITIARAGLCTIVLLEVRRTNTAARRLYEALGFATLGVRKGYYPATGYEREDALVLGLELL